MLEKLATTPVRHLKERALIHTTALATVASAVQAMVKHHRGAVIVEDQDGKVMGIATERDVLAKADPLDTDWLDRAIATLMTPNPTVITENQSIGRALRLLRKGRHRHLPVVDQYGKAVALISVRDVLAYVAEHFPEEFLNLPPEPKKGPSKPWGG